MKTLYLLLSFMLCINITKAQNCNLSVVSGYPDIVNPRCGNNNGSIHILAIGDGQVRYKLNNGNFSPSGNFNNLSPGAYIITMKDDACEIQFNTILENRAEIDFQGLEIVNSGCGDSNGSITVLAEGNNLLYQLNNLEPQSSNTFTELQGGSYNIRIFDNIGCEIITTGLVQSGTIALQAIHTQNSRCGELEGKIEIMASASTNLEYRLVGITDWQNNHVFPNLDIGVYDIEIRDQTGCSLMRRKQVKQILSYTVDKESPLCGQTDGRLEITVHTSGEYEFSLNGGTYSPISTWENLAAGDYTVDIRAVNGGCIRRVNAQINQIPDIFDIEIVRENTPCTQNSGTITISAIGTNLSYRLIQGNEIIDENSSGIFGNLPIGTYIVELISGATGCIERRNVVIAEVNDIVLQEIFTSPSECAEPTGQVSIIASSDLEQQLLFRIDDGEFQSSTEFSNVPAGSHTLYIQSNSGCVAEENFSVFEQNNISITEITTASPTNACISDGSITLSALGTNLSYSLDGITYQEEPIFDSLSQGIYVLYLKNDLGCTKESGEIELATPFMIKNVDIQESRCGEINASVTIQATGSNLLYRLDNQEFVESNIFENLSPGKHTIYVKEEDCIIEEEIEIANIGNLVINSVNTSTSICGEANGSAEIIAEADEDIQYSIDGINYQDSNTFNNLPGGLTIAYIRGINTGCIGTFEFEVPKSEAIEYTLDLSPEICNNGNGSIKINATGGVGTLFYSINGSRYHPDAQFQDLTRGTYLISVKDSLGCVASTKVELDRSCIEVFPTAIAPNRNGKNERFRLLYFEEVEIISYKIFNRWGNLMYEAHHFTTAEDHMFWDGANEMPDAYSCHVVYRMDGEVTEYAGMFQLIR